MSGKTRSGAAFMTAARSTRKVAGLADARIRTIAMAIASTTAMMAMISSMERSSPFPDFSQADWPDRGNNVRKLTVAQPEPAPQHRAKIKSEQNVAEQQTAGLYMRWN